jgi:hypothetical protein
MIVTQADHPKDEPANRVTVKTSGIGRKAAPDRAVQAGEQGNGPPSVEAHAKPEMSLKTGQT